MKIWGKLLLIYVLLLVGIGWFFMMSFEHFKENALTLRTATLQAEYASVLQSNRILADTFFNEVLNREDILALVRQIVHSDGDEQRRQRGLLYRSLSATYQRNKKNVASALHFQFPDNRSMLRFHLPQKADDDLTKKRPSIATVNRSLKAVHGYEAGPYVYAYRHIYPLIYHGEHIGSVEVSQPFFEIFHKMQQLESVHHAHFTVFHNKEMVFAKLTKDQKQNYVVAELHQNLVRRKHLPQIFGEVEDFPAELLPLFTKLKNNEQAQNNISSCDDFSQHVKFEGTTYSVIFHAVNNINNKNAGYLLGITPEPQLDGLINKFGGYYLVTALILLWGLVYRGALRTSRQEKKEIQQTLQSFFNNKLVGMVEVDLDGNYLQVNRRWEEMTGYSQTELLEKTFIDLTHPEELKRQLLLDKHIENKDKETYQMEKRYIRKDGSVFWGDLSTTGLYDTRDQLIGMVGIITDVTEQKQAEENLLKSEQKFRSIFNNTIDVYYRTDAEGRLILASPSIVSTLAYASMEDILGKQISTFYKNPAQRADFLKLLHNQHNVKNYQTILLKGDGSEICVETSANILLDQNGNYAGVEGIVRDITERKLAREALQQAHDKLEQRVIERTETLKKTHDQLLHAEKLSAIGRFSASIAHEFNNPLCGVVNVIEGISARAKLSENDQKLTKLALHECDRMKGLITNLQQFNKPSSDKKVMVNIAQTIDEILLFAKKELTNKKATIIKEIPNDLPEILAVPDQIKQVLINLIGNASDALGSDGGTVSITATVTTNDNMTIAIADTGTGMSPADMKRIFEPFYTTKAIKGTGLGLPVSYGIIKSHGGKIEVKSELGKGTIFTLTIPIEMRHGDDN